MYGTGLEKTFAAEHRLDFAEDEENQRHHHEYKLEIEVFGHRLKEEGYLIDLVDFEKMISEILDKYEGEFLNQHPDLEGEPTVENLSRVLCEEMMENIGSQNIEYVEVRLWESEKAWASFRGEIKS